jgi:quercetin dioxygenase-like cupin family protein
MDVQPSGVTARGPESWFTGEVWIDPIVSGHGPAPLSLGNVHFAPGARTAWHSHTIAQNCTSAPSAVHIGSGAR